ncbi:MAG: CHC2 zinc finger domain-containing protein [Thermomicrobiales bacterium]
MPEQASVADRLALSVLTSDQLADEIEIAHLLWCSLRGPDKQLAHQQLQALRSEHARRQRAYQSARAKPLQMIHRQTRRDLSDRIQALKDDWPIEVYVTRLLAVDLRQHGRDSLFGRCPLPGHADKTGSFHITPSKGLAYCHGCHRGGDVIKLTQLVFGDGHVLAAVERLEHEMGRAA